MDIESEIVLKLSSLERLITNYEFKYNYCKDLFDENKDLFKELEVGSRKYEILHLIITNQCNKVSDIVKLLGLSTSSISLIISKMVESDFIEKKYETTDDSRNVILEVTELGIKNYYILKNLYCKELERFINSLNEDQNKLFYKAIYKLTLALKDFSLTIINEEHTVSEVAEIIFMDLFILKVPFERFFRGARNGLGDELKLTEKKAHILGILSKTEVCTPSMIANITYSSESTISTQLKVLVNEKYVTKEKSKEDNRKTIFAITPLGKETIEKEMKLMQEMFINIIRHFSDEYKINILEGLNNLHILFELLESYN